MLAGVIGAASNVGFLMIAVGGRVFSRHARVVAMDDAGRRESRRAGAVHHRSWSPNRERWKAATKKGDEARWSKSSGRPCLRKTLLAIAFAAIPLIGTWAAVSGWLPPWADKLAGPASTRMPRASFRSRISIGAILGCLVAPIVGGTMGRRPVYFGLCLLSLICCQYMFRTFHAYDASLS